MLLAAALVPAVPPSTGDSHVLATGKHVQEAAKQTSGLAFSGGSVPGALNSQVLFHALEKFVSNDVTMSTVSGGSLGYMLAMNGGSTMPLLDSANSNGQQKWDLERLTNWQADTNSGKLPWNLAAKALDFNALKPCLMDILKEPIQKLKGMLSKMANTIETDTRKFFKKIGTESREEVSAMMADDSSLDLLHAAHAAAERAPHVWMAIVNQTKAEHLAAAGGGSVAEAAHELGVPDSCASTPAAPTLLACVEDILFDYTPIWQCVARYLAKSMAIDIDKVKPGPRPWHVTYSATATKPIAFPIHVPANTTLPALAKQLAVVSYNAFDGTHHSNPSLAISGKRHLLGGVPNVASVKSVNLAYAVAFSSMFINMGTQLADWKGEACKSDLGVPTFALNYANLIDLDYKKEGYFESPEFGKTMVATDGGETDVLGIIPLLRLGKTSIVSAFISPSDPSTYALSRLFGVITRTDECCAYDAMGTSIQVFEDSSLWAPLSAAMTSKDNTGVHVLKDVKVKANAELGVASYTIKTLIFIDNWPKTGFEESVLAGGEVVSALEKEGYPCTSTSELSGHCALEVKVPAATAMALLNHWKVQQNEAVLKEALGYEDEQPVAKSAPALTVGRTLP